ncbi:unnamed protein product [Amoebophrya sp. A120]|nr:unnamed protein product [Amoebophrya sp. A120]|eukprot:GSA120T00012331001.1
MRTLLSPLFRPIISSTPHGGYIPRKRPCFASALLFYCITSCLISPGYSLDFDLLGMLFDFVRGPDRKPMLRRVKPRGTSTTSSTTPAAEAEVDEEVAESGSTLPAGEATATAAMVEEQAATTTAADEEDVLPKRRIRKLQPRGTRTSTATATSAGAATTTFAPENEAAFGRAGTTSGGEDTLQDEIRVAVAGSKSSTTSSEEKQNDHVNTVPGYTTAAEAAKETQSLSRAEGGVKVPAREEDASAKVQEKQKQLGEEDVENHPELDPLKMADDVLKKKDGGMLEGNPDPDTRSTAGVVENNFEDVVKHRGSSELQLSEEELRRKGEKDARDGKNAEKKKPKKMAVTYQNYQDADADEEVSPVNEEATMKKLKREVKNAFGGQESRAAIMDTRKQLQRLDQVSMKLYYNITTFLRDLDTYYKSLSRVESNFWKLAEVDVTDLLQDYDAHVEKRLQLVTTKLGSELSVPGVYGGRSSGKSSSASAEGEKEEKPASMLQLLGVVKKFKQGYRKTNIGGAARKAYSHSKDINNGKVNHHGTKQEGKRQQVTRGGDDHLVNTRSGSTSAEQQNHQTSDKNTINYATADSRIVSLPEQKGRGEGNVDAGLYATPTPEDGGAGAGLSAPRHTAEGSSSSPKENGAETTAREKYSTAAASVWSSAAEDEDDRAAASGEQVQGTNEERAAEYQGGMREEQPNGKDTYTGAGEDISSFPPSNTEAPPAVAAQLSEVEELEM